MKLQNYLFFLFVFVLVLNSRYAFLFIYHLYILFSLRTYMYKLDYLNKNLYWIDLNTIINIKI